MPLDGPGGEAEWVIYNDPDEPGYDPFNNETKAIDGWGEIIDIIAKNVVPVSTTAATAKTNFKAALTGMSNPIGGQAVLLAALNAYAIDLGNGMAPLYTLTTPPVFIPTDLGDPSLAVPATTPADAATFIVGKLVARFMTGVSTLVAPPNTPVNWS